MNKKAEELKKEVENIRSTTHDIEGSKSMYYPVITIKDSPKDKAHSTHHPHVWYNDSYDIYLRILPLIKFVLI